MVKQGGVRGIDYSHAKTNGLRQVTSYDMLVAGIVVIA